MKHQTMMAQTTDFNLDQVIACPDCDLLLESVAIGLNIVLEADQLGSLKKGKYSASVHKVVATVASPSLTGSKLGC